MSTVRRAASTPARRRPITRIPLTRSRRVRALLYQAVFLAALAWLGLSMFQNALENLRARGISSGFDFLTTESNFTISETLPVPLPETGFVLFVLALATGGLATWLLSRWAARRGRRIGDDTALDTLVILLVFVLPGLVLYVTGHTIRTITYQVPSTYGIGLITGLLNTLKVSVVAIVLSTVVGLIIGIARLSSNWLISKVAGTYIELLRNIPLLLQIFFWYFAVLRALPSVRQSVGFGSVVILNNRGVFLANPIAEEGFAAFVVLTLIAILLIFYWRRYVRSRQARTGQQLPVFWPSLGVLIALPALALALSGNPISLEYPELQGFNYRGGIVLTPEFASLLVGLTLYGGAFIAEIVRSGIQAIPKGQTEAARAIGLSPNRVLQLVILPQARRIIIPPMTSTHLGTIKDSSLGVAIGYPELVSISGTILDVSGRALEIIGLTIAFYMSTTLAVSALMNWYNARVRLRSR
jgi:general L-amino acid transport system permease protein